MTKLRLNPLRAPLVYRRWLALAPVLTPALALAGPTGGTVIAGQVNIGQPDALTTLVQQNSQTAVVNWQQFNVGGQELVQFVQPSASAAILNRIVGGSPSEILGNISANGRVFLINTQGVMFGAGSRVDVAGLVASTLDISDADFLNGRYVLAGNGSGAGVVNQGQISAADGGFVVLAGDSARNSGLIQARLGDIVLASGSAMTLDLAGDGLINYRVDGAALSQAAGVANSGQLLADGGRVLMSANVARGLVRDVVNNSGLIRATGVAEENGEIVLLGAGGNVVNTGNLDASSTTSVGGSIQVLGDRDIRIEAGLIDASGAQGGGEIRLGGGIQGGEGLVQAERLYLAEAATVRADATVQGDGGRIAAYSQDHSVLAGLLSARGAGQGGDGGFVETSSHGLLTVTQVPQLSGATGGDWLIDPQDIDIVAGNGYGGISSSNPFEANSDNAQLGVNLITSALSGGTSVTVSTGGSGSQNGDIRLLTALDYNGTGHGTLTLDAAGGIFLNDKIFDSSSGGDSLNLNLNAGGNIVLGSTVDLGADGYANLSAYGDIGLGNLSAGEIQVSTSGNISLAAGQTLRSTAYGIHLTGQSLELSGLLDSAGEISVTASAGNLSGGGDYTAAGYIELYAHESGYGGYGGSAQPGDLVVDQVHAGNGVYISAAGAIQLGANSGYGDVVSAHDYLSIYGDSIRSSGNLVAVGDGDVSIDLAANAGSIDIDGSIQAVSQHGAARLQADAYQTSTYDPQTDSYQTSGGNISVGSIGVRAAESGVEGLPPRLGYNLLGYQPAASALLAADGNIDIGDIRVESYTPLLYASYGGNETLSAASAALLINPGSHASAGTVSLGKVEVYGYGDAHALIRGTGAVTLSDGLKVHSFVAEYIRTDNCDCNDPLTETVLFGNATAEIGEFANYNTNTFATNGLGSGLASEDFKVSLGYLNVRGPNALARISAGSLEIGTDSNPESASYGSSVLVQSHIGVNTQTEYLAEASHTVTDADGNVVYRDNISQAQAEFITSRAGGEQASQLYNGRVRVGGREASLSLQAANGGSIRVADALLGTQLVRGSIDVEGLGYVVDGDYYDYAYGGRGFDSYGLFLRPSLINAPVVTQFDEASPSPYLHWGAASFRVVGGEFVPYDVENPQYGGYLQDAAAGSLSLGGDLRLNGVGAAQGEVWADQVNLAGVRVNAAQGEVFGETGLAYDYGYYVNVQREYYEASNPTSGAVDSYQLRRQISGNHAVETLGGSVQAATAGLAGISFEGADSLHIGGELNVSGLSAEAGINSYASAVVDGAVRLDGRPDGSTPAYLREDLSFLGYSDPLPPTLPDTHSVLVGGRTGLQVNTESLRLNQGVDIRGTLIAGLLIDSADAVITGDVRIDAATGHIESNSPTVTSDPVNLDLGLAAIRLGTSTGSPVRIVDGGLTVIGGTEVDIGGLNLISDGDVRLDAGANGDIRQSLRDLVEQFEHPFTVTPDNRINLADTLDTEPLLSDLLGSSSRTCYAEIADCGFAVNTSGSADIQLNGQQIEAGAGQFSAGGDFTATASTGLEIGTVSAGAVLTLSNSESLSLSGNLSGGTVLLRTDGKFSNASGLVIVAGSGSLSIDAGSIDSAGNAGLLFLGSAGSLQLVADDINLSNYTLSADGAVRLEANTISLGGGSLLGDSLKLVAQSTLSLTGSDLTSNNGTSLSGNSVTVSIAQIDAANLDITSDGVLIIEDDSRLFGSNINLGGAGLLKINTSRIHSSGNLNLTSSDGSVAIGDSSELVGHTVAFVVGGNFSNTGAISVTANTGGLAINAGSVTSGGLLTLHSAGDMRLVANSINLAAYTLQVNGTASMDASSISLGAGSLTGGSLALTAQNALNLAGSSLVIGNDATLRGDSVTLSNAQIGATTLNISSGDALLIGSSELRSSALSLMGKSIAIEGGSLLSGSAISLGSASLLKIDSARIDSSGNLSLTASSDSVVIGNDSELNGHNVQLRGNVIDTRQARITATGDLSAIAADDLMLGRTSVGGALSLQAGDILSLSNSESLSLGGSLSGNTVSLSTAGAFGNAGALHVAAGTGGLVIHAGAIGSTDLLSLSSTGGLELVAANSINLAGYVLSATGAAHLAANTITLGSGALSGGSLTLAAQNALNLDGGNLTTGAGATLSGSLVKVSNTLIEAASLGITSGNTLRINNHSVLRGGTLNLTGKTVTIEGGSAQSGSAITIGSTGLLTIDGSQADSSGSLSLSSSGGSVAISNDSLLRGVNLQLHGKGAVSVENSRLLVSNNLEASGGKALTSIPAGSIELKGAGLTLRNAELAGGDVRLLGGVGLVTLDGGSIEGNIVRIEADSVTTPSAVQISANGFGARGKILDFGLASFSFGSGAAPFGDDEGLIEALTGTNADLRPSSGPNASFVASQFLTLGAISGSAHYLLFDSSDFTFNGTVRGASDLFLQVIPTDDRAPLGISDLSFARFARSLAIGSNNYSGDIFLLDGNGGPAGKALNAGTGTNYIFLTGGKVSGADKISTNGRVVVLGRVDTGVPEDIRSAGAKDLVLVSSDFSPAGPPSDAERASNPLLPDRSLPGHGGVSSDDSGDTQQQCDAI
ncbi:filamentous hemagglutinin N-terminal domain-containing protein [Stagnimonas aquatica]|uniref:Filamentous hemagglutinin N-terminal domain-containing protein n=1 Tax=Stagnimonas aquatica TaxID=2689987 RepID=A0A3N0V8L3_9GAMM|nr:filamentous hemagglutinin N-terminal domain-containing protein [Stagnimonas aquatica]ROH89103.1 filamentous hemagglutinin N-terminal domain-containing protein [Stagnimonas aquatica]